MSDEWTVDGARISPELLARLRSIIEDESAVIVEHRIYRGASAPRRFVCDDADELERYLVTSTKPGDSTMASPARLVITPLFRTLKWPR